MFRYCVVYLVAIGLLFPLAAGAVKEAVKDVRFRTYVDRAYEDKVHISYILVGKGEYEVSLRLSNDGGQTWYSIGPKSLSGDVGKGVKPGRDKWIIWDGLRDVRRLKGDDFVFEVVAIRNRNRRPVLMFLGLAAAAAVGMAAASMGQEGQGDGTIIVEIPDPEENP